MKTPTDTPRDTPQNTPQNTPADKLIELNDRAAACVEEGTPAQVELLRITGTTRAPVAKIDAAQWDSFSVGSQFGGGRYMARLKVGGKFDVSATFDAEGPTLDRTPAFPFAGVNPHAMPAMQPTQPAAQASSDSLSSRDFLQLMMNQQAQQQTMFMEMMRQNSAQTQMMMQTIVSKTRETPMSEMLTTFKEMKGLAAEGEGGGGGGMVSEIAELGKAIGPILAPFVAEAMKGNAAPPGRRPMQPGPKRHAPSIASKPAANAAPAQPASPADVNAAATEGNTTEQRARKLMMAQLQTLRQLARAAVAPRVAAHSLFGMVDDIENDEVRDAVLDSIANTTPEDFANAIPMIAPEFSQPGHRDWVVKVHTELRAMVEDAQAQADDPDDASTAGDPETGTAEDTKAKSEET